MITEGAEQEASPGRTSPGQRKGDREPRACPGTLPEPSPLPHPYAPGSSHANPGSEAKRRIQKSRDADNPWRLQQSPEAVKCPRLKGSQGFWDEVCQGQEVASSPGRDVRCGGTQAFLEVAVEGW